MRLLISKLQWLSPWFSTYVWIKGRLNPLIATTLSPRYSLIHPTNHQIWPPPSDSKVELQPKRWAQCVVHVWEWVCAWGRERELCRTINRTHWTSVSAWQTGEGDTKMTHSKNHWNSLDDHASNKILQYFCEWDLADLGWLWILIFNSIERLEFYCPKACFIILHKINKLASPLLAIVQTKKGVLLVPRLEKVKLFTLQFYWT